MKVKAKRWINVGGEWHGAGDVFDVPSLAGIGNAVEVVAEPRVEETVKKEKPANPEKVEESVSVEAKADEPKSATRRRKTAK